MVLLNIATFHNTLTGQDTVKSKVAFGIRVNSQNSLPRAMLFSGNFKNNFQIGSGEGGFGLIQ
jgi:hypothetical protein